MFVADRFLKELEQNYCGDLLKDTNNALSWLDEVNTKYTTQEKKKMKAFTFDFKSLYDNLKPELVKEAVQHAMQSCRPGWSTQKKKWILDLIDLSLRASIGKFKDNWYIQKNGVPTGGSLCVQLANITVFYLMNKAVYSQPRLMQNVKEAMRYIDDGAGFYVGSERSFNTWLNAVNQALQPYGLLIDESVIKEIGEFAPFLDVLFCFDKNGQLQTDLFVKPTDARSYLNISSAHPKHIFSGIVYSQCLRLRRIINNQERLKQRLTELCQAFKKSGYPNQMLVKISSKVLNMQRTINQPLDNQPVEETDTKPILVVSTFGTDEKLVNSLKSREDELSHTNSFRTSSKPLFQFVKKTGPNLGNMLSVLKSLALGKKSGKTVPCNMHSNCKCCPLIGDNPVTELYGHPIRSAPGTCKTKNIIYLVICCLCNKPYCGRTIQILGKRMGGHRECFYQILRNEDVDISKDDYSLGLHLFHEHGLRAPEDFNKHYRVQILEVCSPARIEKKEHYYIHRYNTLHPIGLNKVNPFGLSRLST